MKKVFRWGWIILTIGLLMIGLGFGMHGSKEVSFDNWKPRVGQDSRVNKVYPKISKFTEIDVSATEADIIFVRGSKYAVEYSGRTKYKPSVRVENQKLIVRQTQSGSNEFHLSFGYNDNSESAERIIVSVPQDVSLDRVKAKSTLGDIKVNDREINDLELTSNAGDIGLNNVTASKVEISASDGDLALNKVHLNSGTISQKNGDMMLKTGEVSQVKVQNQDGDVSYSDVKLNNGSLEMQDGDFEADRISVVGSYSVNNSDGDNIVRNSQAGGYHLTTSGGTNKLYGRSSENNMVQNNEKSNILRMLTNDGDNEVK